MQKKDVYASLGTVAICGLMLLLLLWLKLIIPAPLPEEQGIEVGYGVDLEGEFGGSQGGLQGDYGGSLDGDFYAEQNIVVPTFSEAPAVRTSKATTSIETKVENSTGEDILAQSEEEVVSVKQGNVSQATTNSTVVAGNVTSSSQTNSAKQAATDKARSLGVNAFGKAGGSGKGGFGLGAGTGAGSGNGSGTGIGDGTGSGTRGNPLGSGSSNGNTWSLKGRSLSGNISKPAYRQNVEGKITVDIRVDASGNVINASIGSPTTIADEALRKSTLESALRTKFSKGDGTVYGRIVYLFKLN